MNSIKNFISEGAGLIVCPPHSASVQAERRRCKRDAPQGEIVPCSFEEEKV